MFITLNMFQVFPYVQTNFYLKVVHFGSSWMNMFAALRMNILTSTIYALLSLALSAILDSFSEYNGENPCQSKV